MLGRLGSVGRVCPLVNHQRLLNNLFDRSYTAAVVLLGGRTGCGGAAKLQVSSSYASQHRLFSSGSRPLPEESREEVTHSSSAPPPQISKDPAVEALVSSSSANETDATEFTLMLTDEEMDQLTGGDEEAVKKVKYIQLEHEVYRQEGMNVPSKVGPRHWKELLALPSPGTRRRYYNFLFLNEMKSQNDRMKRQQRKEERMKELEESGQLWGEKGDDPNGVIYGLGRNSLFLRLYDTTVNRFHHNKVAQAMRFGRPLVLDCSYDEFMTPRESKNCAKQIELMLSQNRSHNEPFDLHLCNAPRDSRLIQCLTRINPALYDDTHPIHVTDKSYLDVFPHKELVYLTPNAREELEEFSEDEIYIIGAMVDKSDPRPLSMAKAKRENLRMKKLPLDKHLVWGLGGKSLTINQMVAIMLDIRATRGDWKAALDHVPKRKLNRDFHPYPNQINEGNRYPENPEYIRQQHPSRHEHRSPVLEDFEFNNRRKGFRGYDTSNSGSDYRAPKYQARFNERNNNYKDGNNKNKNKISARSLFEE